VAVAVAPVEAVVLGLPQVAAQGLAQVALVAVAAAAAAAADDEFSVWLFQFMKGAHHEDVPGSGSGSRPCEA
jgi:hypothetical protein